MADTAKLRVRIAQLEVDFEGPDAYMRNDLPKLIDSLIKSHRELIAAPPASAGVAASKGATAGAAHDETPSISAADASTSSIAAKTGAKTGPDLALCAAASLTVAQGKSEFDRKDILAEMKSASAYYEKNYSANLTKTLDSHVKSGTLKHLAGTKYALSADQRKRFRDELAKQ